MTTNRYFIRFTDRITHFLIFSEDGSYKSMTVSAEEDYPWYCEGQVALKYVIANHNDLYKEVNEEDFNKLLITQKYPLT